MTRTIGLAGLRSGPVIIQSIIQQCSCRRSTAIPQRPRLNRRLCSQPGRILFLDIIYPLSDQKFPAIFAICGFSKFVMSRFAANIKASTLVSFVVNRWPILLGMPECISSDRGTAFGGSPWKDLIAIYGTTIVAAPTKAHYQIGIAERHRSLLKDGFSALWRSNTLGWIRDDILSIACVSKNLTPLSSCSLSPLHIVTGRGDYIDRLIDSPSTPT